MAAKLAEFCGAEGDAVTLDACEEPGRLDIQTTENDAGEMPTRTELEEWKAGKRDLWAVTYSAQVEQVERRPVALASEGAP